MTLHVSLASKNIVNLYVGTAEDALPHQADWLQPTTDVVNYSDGTSDEVYGCRHPGGGSWTRTSPLPSSARRASGTTTPSASAMHSPRPKEALADTAPTPAT